MAYQTVDYPSSAVKIGKGKVYKTTKDIAKASQVVQQMAGDLTTRVSNANLQESANARQFQRWMSEHSHQMEVNDLKEAGLNPVLSANTGAQSYTSAQGSAQMDSATNAVSNLVSTKYASDSNAAASKYAARMNYKAAQASAAATIAAARESAAAQKYAADAHKSSTMWGNIDNFLKGVGLNGSTGTGALIKSIGSFVNRQITQRVSAPTEISKLTQNQQSMLKVYASKLGLPKNNTGMYMAYKIGNSKSQKEFNYWYRLAMRKRSAGYKW